MINEIVSVKSKNDCVSYETEKIKDYKGIDGEKALSHSFVMDTLRKLMGKTLTIIDATISDERQNKSTKDLIRNIYSDEMEFSANLAFDQDKIQKMIPDIEPEQLGQVSIEEALGVE